jgi:hypothetical protein
MAINLSTELKNALYGDEAVLKYIDICKVSFDAGDRTALFELLELCARFQAVIPEWAADEILKVSQQLEDGEMTDFNDFFGFKVPHKTVIKRDARLRKLESAIRNELFHYRCNGGSFNAEEAFGVIAERLNVSRRDIEAIYKRNPFLKNIPQTQSDNKILIYGDLKAPPPPRRSGRSILKDS